MKVPPKIVCINFKATECNPFSIFLKPIDGVTVEDMGYKIGLNGVDNAKLSFDHVRVPRTNLLNKYSDINDEGK